MSVVRLVSDNKGMGTASNIKLMIGDVEIPNVVSVKIGDIDAGNLLVADIRMGIAFGGEDDLPSTIAKELSKGGITSRLTGLRD